MRSYSDELRLEVRKPKIDQLPTAEVWLGIAPDLDRVSSSGRCVVHQESNVRIAQHVAPLLGVAEVHTSNIDCVLSGIEAIGQRN